MVIEIEAPQNKAPRLSLQKLDPVLFNQQTNQDLSQMLHWKTAKLLTMLGLMKLDHYSVLYLKKKSKKTGTTGKYRILHNPDNLMRQVQYRILKNILEKITVPEYIY